MPGYGCVHKEDIMISKELLSLVLDKKVQSFDPNIVFDENDIRGHSYLMVVLEDETDQYGISVAYVTDHVGRLCKEWCIKQKYAVTSGITLSVIADTRYECVVTQNKIHREYSPYSELEAIIKATEWVAKDLP